MSIEQYFIFGETYDHLNTYLFNVKYNLTNYKQKMFSKNIAKTENNIIYQFKAIIIPLNEVCHSLFLKDLEYNAYM